MIEFTDITNFLTQKFKIYKTKAFVKNCKTIRNILYLKKIIEIFILCCLILNIKKKGAFFYD